MLYSYCERYSIQWACHWDRSHWKSKFCKVLWSVWMWMCEPSKSTCHFLSTLIITNISCSWTGLFHSVLFICLLLNATGCASSHVSPNGSTAPILLLLVSHVTNILLFLGFSWLIVVKQSLLMTRCLMLLNIAWWWQVQVGKAMLHSLQVSSMSIMVYLARVGRNNAMYLTSPRNWCICFANFGAGQLRIWRTFDWSTSIPHAKMWCPEKLISIVNSVDFFSEQYNWASLSTSRTIAMFCLCSSSVSDKMIMSSRYTWHIFPIRSLSASVTCLWCMASEFHIPMGIMTHSHNPNGVSIAVYLMSSRCTRVWKNEFIMLILPQIFPLAQSTRMLLIHGSG